METKKRPKLYRNMPGLVRASINPFLLRLRNNPERLMFMLHRITGVVLIGYLMLHVIVTSFSVDAQRWDTLMEEFGSSLANKIGEFIVAGAAIFHGLNGIRLLLVEFFGLGIGKPEHPKPPYVAPSLRSGQRTAIYVVVILWLIAWFFAGLLIFTGRVGFG